MNEETKTSTAMTTTETETPAATGASIVPLEGGNFELSATTPLQMRECHQTMIEWCKNKIGLVGNEVRELKAAYEHAVKCKWKNDTLKKHYGLATRRLTFYEKMLAAFESGYFIVPNFPVTLFAIRTDRDAPKKQFAMLRYAHEQNREQDADMLPAGEGEYQNPNPVILSGQEQTVRRDNQDVKRMPVWNEDWAEMEFPANMARLNVMEAANRAMALKVFDEIGFLPEDHRRNPDPVLIGRLIIPGPAKWHDARVSFLIAWHISTAAL